MSEANKYYVAGGQYFSDTSAHAGNWGAIFAHSAAVVGTATSEARNGMAGTLTSVAIPAGVTWFANLSTFTLASGAVTAYLRP